MSVSKAVEEVLLAGDTQLPADKVESMEQVLMDSTAQANFNVVLLGIFAGIALLLAAVGISGVMGSGRLPGSVLWRRQRTPEIAIRMALGAAFPVWITDRSVLLTGDTVGARGSGFAEIGAPQQIPYDA